MTEKVNLDAPEVQAAIQSAVAEAITGLKNKNTELLGELKAARKNATIDPEDFNRLREEKDALSEKVSELNKALKTAQDDATKFNKLYQDEVNNSVKLSIDSELSKALTDAKVKPELVKAAKALFQSQVNIGKDRAISLEGKSIVDYIKTWSESDEGKHFISAPLNSGGNSTGNLGGGTSQKTIVRSAFDAMSQVDRSNFAKSGGTVIDG